MQYIDIGINLMHRSFEPDREQIIQEAAHLGVSPLILTGTSVKESRAASQYAAKHPSQLYSTAGVHPHDAKSCNDNTISQLRQLLEQPQVVAVGECGLDYDRDFSPRPVQLEWFEKQLELAKEMNLPLFLHECKAFSDFYELLKQYSELCSQSVVHCFTGTLKELNAYLGLGCYIGITGWICDERRGMTLRSIVSRIPKDRIMIETDAPFLTPRDLPNRPQRNEPKYLPHICAEIAKWRRESPEELAKISTENAMRFFSLSNTSQ